MISLKDKATICQRVNLIMDEYGVRVNNYSVKQRDRLQNQAARCGPRTLTFKNKSHSADANL
jgi:hypothetical protein